jgi:hypothetical protein
VKHSSLSIVLLATGLLVSCSHLSPKLNPERSEAIKFCQLLQEEQHKLASLNGEQHYLTDNLKPWGQRIEQVGGNGQDLKDASHYFERSEYLRDGLKKIQEDIKQADIKTAFNQTVRSSLLPKIEKRVQEAEELRNYVKGCYDYLPQGDVPQIPRAVVQLNTLLKSLPPGDDVITPAMKELRTKYEITDEELVKGG